MASKWNSALYLAVILLLVRYIDSQPTPLQAPVTNLTAPVAPTETPINVATGPCPRDALKLGVCANVLKGLLNVTIGTPPKEPCCSLIKDLVDLDAAICLCTAIKGKILGLDLHLPVSLSLVLNYCGFGTPHEFQCA